MSKRIFSHPEPSANDFTGPRYWKSLDDLAETSEFKDWVEREFPEGASELEGVDRRKFMKLMAASFGLAGVGMAGCRQPRRYILPYAQQPEYTPVGVPSYYSTSFSIGNQTIPLVVETHGARPIKIEGNPSYKPFGGGSSIFAQASILDLYDPERFTDSVRNGGKASKAEVSTALSELSEAMASASGEGYAIVTGKSSSPTRLRLLETIKKKYPSISIVEYEASQPGFQESALEKYAGKPVKALYDLTKAERVLSVGADITGGENGSLNLIRGFSQGRAIDDPKEADKMNRLYSVEGDFSLTGGMADHRLRLGASQMPAFIALVGAEIFEAFNFDADLVATLRGKGSSLQAHDEWIKACAQDLVNHKQHSAVLAGIQLPEEVHVIVAAINKVLHAEDGGLLRYVETPKTASTHSIIELGAAISEGSVKNLIVLSSNPAFDAPASAGFTDALGKLDSLTTLSYYDTETTESAGLRIAESHYLESWGDARTFDGTLVPVQPMIEPLFDTFTALEILGILAGETGKSGYDMVSETFATIANGDDVATKMKIFLSEGLLPDSGFAATSLSISASKVSEFAEQIMPASVLSKDSLEAIFVPSKHVFDGRYANNGWLLECPEPMTKLTWDNAVVISPRLARELEEEQGIQILPGTTIMQSMGKFRANARDNKYVRGKEIAPMAEITVDGVTVKAPLHVMPGLANYSVILPYGFGRRVVGRIGQNTGFDFFPLKSTDATTAVGVDIKLTEETYVLANTQEHWSMEGRAIVREATVDDFKKHPDFVSKMGMEAHSPAIYGKDKKKSVQYKATKTPRGGSAYETPDFTYPQQWGMTIDLNLCFGCNACVVACQSENNIPIVGKDQVLRGREMHWVRLDRYFAADVDKDPNIHSSAGETGSAMNGWHQGIPEDVQVTFMGLSCVHCELAPCEQVCPVNATVHDDQGLNVMAYNRCIGTRYCANNCPYKVRRFNFFDWNKRQISDLYLGPLGKKNTDGPKGELVKMRNNPDVTVRMRGVMEKCTYCVQRIQGAKIRQKARAKDSNDIKVRDGAIKVACQMVCPTDAIKFGDIADETTEVSKAKDSKRNYALLGYLNVRPRTTYLAKLRNPNPSMPDAYKQPWGRKDYENRYGHGGHEEHGHGDHAGHDHENHAPAAH